VRFVIAVWLALAVFLVGYGSKLTWHAVVAMPRAYKHLRRYGVPVTGRLSDCTGGDEITAGGVSGHKPLRCRVKVSFEGVSRAWEYPYSLDEHGDGPVQPLDTSDQGPVSMLLDPHHPRTAYTVYDVDRSTGAGWNRWSFFGVLLVGAGLLLLGVPVLVNYLPE
jgi:hypothetical protein